MASANIYISADGGGDNEPRMVVIYGLDRFGAAEREIEIQRRAAEADNQNEPMVFTADDVYTPITDGELPVRLTLAESIALIHTRSEDVQMRLAAQKALYLAARADGFAGPRWDLLAEELLRYAIGKLQGLILSGEMFILVTKKLGRSASLRDDELALITSDPHLLTQLAGQVAAKTMIKFEADLRNGRSWDPDKALLTTYFIDRCLNEFNNEFREWYGEVTPRRLEQPAKSEDDFHDLIAEAAARPPNPEENAVGLDTANRIEIEFTDREHRIIQLRKRGFSINEIAETLDGETRKSVDGVLQRLRHKVIRSQLEGNNNE